MFEMSKPSREGSKWRRRTLDIPRMRQIFFQSLPCLDVLVIGLRANAKNVGQHAADMPTPGVVDGYSATGRTKAS